MIDKMMFAGLLVAIGFVVLFVIASIHDDIAVEKMAELCEAKGGALLDHTERRGKVTHHNYVCIDQKVIIEY